MERTIAPADERRFTRAVEKAASLMAVNMDHNPNELLANQLKQDNVDKRFAKLAAQAFNKRATIIHLSHTDDAHKAEDFPLADPDTVYQLCGGADMPETKTASAASPTSNITEAVFNYTPKAQEMTKAASAQSSAYIPYECRVNAYVINRTLSGMLDKCANAFSELNYEYNKLEKSVGERADGIARWFNKTACQSFEFTTAAKLFGQDIKRALGDRIPDMPLEKCANVVNPGTPVIQGLGRLIEDMDKLAALKTEIVEFGKYTGQFMKAAEAWGTAYTRSGGDAMHKEAAPGALQTMGDYVHNWRKEDHPNQVNLVKGMGEIALTAPVTAGELLVGAGRNVLGDVQTLGTSAWNHAMENYYAGRDRDVSPGKVLDAEFLNQDRLRDRMMAVSELSVDPGLKAYPFKDVFRASMKAMDTNMALERPDQREVLRTYVAQMLPQNNRASMADLAALGSVMDSRKEQESAAAAAAKAVSALSDKTAPDYVKLDIPDSWLAQKEIKTPSLDALMEALKERKKMAVEDVKDRAKSKSEGARELDNAALEALKRSERVEQVLRAKNLSPKDVDFVLSPDGRIQVHAKKDRSHLLTLDAADFAKARAAVQNATRMLGSGNPMNLYEKSMKS